MAVPSLTSRLLNTFLTSDGNGRRLYEVRKAMSRSRGLGTRRFVLAEGATLADVAFDVYGDPRLYWAIADFNGIFDVTTELTAGMELVIPSLDAVKRYLSRSALERID